MAAITRSPTARMISESLEATKRFSDHPVMGFNKRKIEDQRRTAAEREAVARMSYRSKW